MTIFYEKKAKIFLMKKLLPHLFLGTLTTVVILAITIAYWFQYPQKNQQAVVLIEKGKTLSQITARLHQQKILNYPFLFKGILYGTGGWRYLKAGEYLIPPSITPAQLMHILRSGNVILHPVTLIEGETSHHLTQRLLNDSHFQGVCELPPEGSLLPETYHFPRGTDRQKIVIQMQKAMQTALAQIWANRSPEHPLQSPEELVVLASIVEKETALPPERPLVAAVFLNRLKQGIPLQADPTIIYGLTHGKESLDRILSREDLKFESPYNTYLHAGLPPSPIANPSLACLKAVAHPENVSYLYFVADGSGGHVFSTTLKDHQKNHAQWREVRTEKLAETP